MFRQFFWNYALMIGMGMGLSLVWISFYVQERDSEYADTASGEPIGFVESSVEDVRRRPRRQILWSYLPSERPVYEKDTIRTGPGSSARINLGTKGAVELQENSLAVLETENEGMQVHLASGSLFLKGDLTAKVEGRVIVAKGADVELRREMGSNQVRIESRKGSVTVTEAGGKRIDMKQGERLDQDASGATRVRKLPLKFRQPVEGAALETLEPKLWLTAELTREVDDFAGPALVEIAEDEAFERPRAVARATREGKSFRARVEVPGSGRWFARARSPAGDTLSGAVSFSAEFKTPPPKPPGAPIQFAARLDESNYRQATLVWAPPADAPVPPGYELAVGSRIEKLATPAFEIAAEDARRALDGGGGLRVRSIAADGLASPWTDFAGDAAMLAFDAHLARAPRLVLPGPERQLNPQAMSEIAFRWQAVEHAHFKASAYELRLEGPEKSSRPQTASTVSTSLKLATPRPGRYQWSVRALYPGNRAGTWGEKRTLTVDKPLLAAPRIRAPASSDKER